MTKYYFLVLSIAIFGIYYVHADDSDPVDFKKATAKEEDLLFVYCEKDKQQQEFTTKSSSVKLGYGTLFVIIHGSKQSHKTKWVQDLKNKLLDQYKVLIVDWAKAANTHEQAADNTQFVGSTLAKFLIKANVFTFNLVLVGFGTGGHAAGQAGKYFRTNKNSAVQGLFALDPAAPKFEFASTSGKKVPPENKLTKDDAQNVLVLHTNCQKEGIKAETGHVDWYANDGNSQPGCSNDTCSHLRATDLFIESFDKEIETKQIKVLVGTKSVRISQVDNPKEANLGFAVEPDAEGPYGFKTNAKSPFLIQTN